MCDITTKVKYCVVILKKVEEAKNAAELQISLRFAIDLQMKFQEIYYDLLFNM